MKLLASKTLFPKGDNSYYYWFGYPISIFEVGSIPDRFLYEIKQNSESLKSGNTGEKNP